MEDQLQFRSSSTQMAVTRESSQQELEEGTPQLIPVHSNLDRGLVYPASSSEGQQKFLELMGLTNASIDIQQENVFEDQEARVISTALNHSIMDQDTAGDPYFTPEEWRMHEKKMKDTMDQLYKTAVSKEGVTEDSPLGTQYKECKKPRCNCIAHQSEQQLVWKLIDIPEKLTDDWGSKMANTLLPEIFKRANLFDLEVEDCKQGGVYTVNYILQMPSGNAYQFTGWPDFTISCRYTPTAENGIAMTYHRSTRLHGIGEVESTTTKDRTRALAQGGIYGVGQLANSLRKKMAVIILYKDKSAQVAVATTHLPTISLDESSVGDVKYQFVSRADPMSLKDADELQEFAKILVSTIKWALS